MKTISKIFTEKSMLTFLLLSFTFLFQACNPNEDTGENLVGSDIGDNSDREIDIYVLNENTLYGLRDNNRPSVNGIGTIEPFLSTQIPGYVTASSPTFSYSKQGNGSYYEGRYTDTGLTVSSTNGILYHYNIPGGSLFWQTDLGGSSSATPSKSFYISGEKKYFKSVGTNNGKLHFINNSTGEIYYTYTNPNEAGFDSKAAVFEFLSSGGYRIAAGSTDGFIYYFRNSTFLRSYDTGASILAGPIFVYDHDSEELEVFVGNSNGELFRLANSLDELIWKIQLTGTIYAEPTIGYVDGTGDGKLYVTTTDGMVYKIDKATGDIDWEFQAEGLVYSSVEISPYTNLLYFTCTDGSVYALNRSGVLQWKTDLGDGALYATPNFTDIREDQLYVNTVNGVYGLNANTGEVFSNFTVEHSPNADVSGNFKSSPAVFAFLR